MRPSGRAGPRNLKPADARGDRRSHPERTGDRMTLAATQDALLSLIAGHPARTGAPAASTLVLGDDRASADVRLEIYQHMYRVRIVEAMGTQFPRLANHLGDDAFAELVLGYVADHPSRDPSLRFIGQRLPDWLERHRGDHPWLADLARLEWARADVFDVLDEAALTLDDLRGLDPERFAGLPLRLIHARRMIITDYAVADFWSRLGGEDGEAPTRPSEADDDAGETLLVWRQDSVVYHRPIAGGELAALEQVALGTTFGALCEGLAARMSPEAATTMAFTWLSMWVTDGLLRAVA